jgi:anion-transporting  ArsA/GET3 family ATPase
LDPQPRRLRSGAMTAARRDDQTRQAWSGVRLHIVTGKGGTGKTTVAASLALALAAGGRKILLCEAEGRQGIAQLFDVAPLPYEERRIAVAPDGGDLYALAIDPEEALLEYLDMYYKMRRAGRALDRFGVIDFATTIAPGLRDVLLTGKVYEATRRRRPAKRSVYDAVVLDAPPTGRIARFLNVNKEVAGLAKVGPIRKQGDAIMSLMRSDRTRIHLVTVLEEMPVQETGDAMAELRTAGLPIGGVVINLVRRPVLDERARKAVANGKVPDDAVRAGLVAAGLEDKPQIISGLLTEARDHAERLALEAEERRVVERLGQPVCELPQLTDGIDLGGLYELAADLRDQGMA